MRRRILLAFERAEREPDQVKRQGLLTFVIVGGGPTGVELAGAVAEISRHVMVQDFRAIDPREARMLLVEGGPYLLPEYPKDLSGKAEAALKRMGVEVLKNSKVTLIDQDGVFIGDQQIKTQTVLWAAGVRASPLGQSLGATLDRTGRVRVQPDLSIPWASGNLCNRRLGNTIGPRRAARAGSGTGSRSGGKACGQKYSESVRGKAIGAFPLFRQGKSRHHRARLRCRAFWTDQAVRLYCLGHVVGRPHFLPDRLPEPAFGDGRLGVGVFRRPARGSIGDRE